MVARRGVGGGDGSSFSPQVWQVTRASLDFVLDIVRLSRGDGDLLAPLLFTAILEANLAPLNRDRDLQLAFAGLDASAPDELRRPVSINAVAQSLRLPFETVRRRVRRLAAAGACVITPHGVYVPRSAVTSPAYNALQLARHERLGGFYAALQAAGALPASDAAAPPLQDDAPVRATNRAISEYMLRAANDLIGMTGDALTSLVLLALARENTGHLDAAGLDAWSRDPLTLGRPVRAARLAAQLALAAETTRRHLVALETGGFSRRTPAGALVTAPPDAWPALAQLVDANVANVQRLFARLRHLGALSAWDRTGE